MNWNEGVAIIGRTGGGKSTIIKAMAPEMIRAGSGVYWHCMKPDEADIAEAIIRKARKKPIRTSELNFNPFWEMSRRGGNATSLSNIITDINEVITRPGREGEKFWEGHNTTCTTNAINLTHLAHAEHASLEAVYQFLASVPENLEQTRKSEFKESHCWKTILLADARATTPEQKRQVILASDYFLKQLPSAGEKARGAILSGVLNSLSYFVMAPLKSGKSFDPDKAVLEGQCIIADKDVLTHGKEGLADQLLYSFFLVEAVLRRRNTSRPFMVVKDEYQISCHPGRDIKAQTVARSQNYVSLIAFQTIPVLVDGLGGGIEAKNQAQALYACHVNKLMCNNNCPETNELNSKIIGMKRRLFFSTSPSQKENPLDVLGVGAFNVSTSQQYHYIFPPANFMCLRTGGKENKLFVDAIYHNGRTHSLATYKQR
jgi:hypothetical protein